MEEEDRERTAEPMAAVVRAAETAALALERLAEESLEQGGDVKKVAELVRAIHVHAETLKALGGGAEQEAVRIIIEGPEEACL